MILPPCEDPAAVAARFVNIARTHGYTIRYRRPGSWLPGRSWCDPITRTVWLRHDADIGTARGVALLAHEVTHADQQAGPWWRRFWWGLRYLADPWFRRAAEIEAEAWWTAVMVALRYRRDAVWQPAVRAWAKQSHALGNWRAPHYTPGDPNEMTDRIAARAREVLVD